MMRALLLATTLATLAPISAHAGVVCFGLTDTCATDTEHKIFLKAGNGATGLGNVDSQRGTPLVDFASPGTTLDYKNGFANIDPHGSGKSFSSLDITIPGYDFTDLVYDAQMFKNNADDSLSFTITVWNDGAQVGSHTYSNLAQDSDITYDVTGLFDEVVFTSDSGFKEMKHFEVSGLTLDGGAPTQTSGVPEPSTWAMLLLGFAGLGYAGFRQSRKERVSRWIA
jgi:hypothetical protein